MPAGRDRWKGIPHFGVTDHELALVQVGIIHATYRACDTGKTTQLLCNAAAVTGKPAPSLGEHAKIHLA